jgi:hypothetical protein
MKLKIMAVLAMFLTFSSFSTGKTGNPIIKKGVYFQPVEIKKDDFILNAELPSYDEVSFETNLGIVEITGEDADYLYEIVVFPFNFNISSSNQFNDIVYTFFDAQEYSIQVPEKDPSGAKYVLDLIPHDVSNYNLVRTYYFKSYIVMAFMDTDSKVKDEFLEGFRFK